MKEVAGKVAFITGGSSGIGLGIARAFAEAGMKVVVTYRTKSHVESALKVLGNAIDRVHAIEVDVTDREGMERAAEETVSLFGKVHVLVNNAGVVVQAPLSKTTYEDWDWVVNVNLNGVFNGVHVFLPRLLSHGEGGHIVTTSSTSGLVALPGSSAYSPTKFAVVAMMEALRAELLDSKIGCSVYCPGVVSTDVAEANRNRPTSLARTGDERDRNAMAKQREAMRDPGFAMDPFEAGRLVLQGIQNDDLYILTHPEWEGVIRDRNEAIAASIPSHSKLMESRLAAWSSVFKASIYGKERDRRLRRKDSS
jgi:NAD(P)-dependent dehydrogenase (short-subunit alcohol dehydrogenase family)